MNDEVLGAKHHLPRGLKRLAARRAHLRSNFLRTLGRYIIYLFLFVVLFNVLWQAAAMLKTQSSMPVVTPSKMVAAPESTWLIQEFAGKDAYNRNADFELWVLSNSYQWSFGSSSKVEFNQTEASFAEHLGSVGMRSRLQQASGLIMIGTASMEGPIALEEKRAHERANQLMNWVEAADTDAMLHDYFTLNLGRYSRVVPTDSQSSASQRPIIIISVRHKDQDVDLKSALRNGLDSLPGFRIRLSDYSKFELEARSGVLSH